MWFHSLQVSFDFKKVRVQDSSASFFLPKNLVPELQLPHGGNLSAGRGAKDRSSELGTELFPSAPNGFIPFHSIPFHFISVSSNMFQFCPVHHLFASKDLVISFLGPGRINSAAWRKHMRLLIHHPSMVSVRDSIRIVIACDY